MKIIPVIDIRKNVVVHAICGHRDNYTPIKSTLSLSSDPIEIVKAFQNYFEFSTFYIADLDAIEKKGANNEVIEKILERGVKIYLDSGIKTYDEYISLKKEHVRLIIATETIEDTTELTKIIAYDPTAVLSIDIKNGALVSKMNISVDELLTILDSTALKRLILLYLSCVGSGKMQNLTLVSKIANLKKYEIIVGGGITTWNDLVKLKKMGVNAALLATALHNKVITKKDIDSIL